MSLGFRVLPGIRKVSDEVLELYRQFSTTHVSDNMNRMDSVQAAIRPMHQSGLLLGHAFTVKTRPGDNLLVHKAIDVAEPGDVILIDAGGELTHAMLGEIMVRIGMKRGVAGFVVDGAIRDSQALRTLNLPVYAKGITHRGPYKDGPGEINVSIQIGGTVVHPGDLVFGDQDGIVIVPAEEAPGLVDKIQATIDRENQIMQSIEDGTLDRGWVDKLLRSKGCEGV